MRQSWGVGVKKSWTSGTGLMKQGFFLPSWKTERVEEDSTMRKEKKGWKNQRDKE